MTGRVGLLDNPRLNKANFEGQIRLKEMFIPPVDKYNFYIIFSHVRYRRMCTGRPM